MVNVGFEQPCHFLRRLGLTGHGVEELPDDVFRHAWVVALDGADLVWSCYALSKPQRCCFVDGIWRRWRWRGNAAIVRLGAREGWWDGHLHRRCGGVVVLVVEWRVRGCQVRGMVLRCGQAQRCDVRVRIRHGIRRL